MSGVCLAEGVGPPLLAAAAEGMTGMFLACRDCGQIHGAAAGALRRRWLLCRRCGARLSRFPAGGFDRPLAYTVAGLILFALANVFPLFTVSLQGNRRSDLLIGGALELGHYGWALAGLGILVAVLSIVVPGIRLALLWFVLTGLGPAGRGDARRPPLAAAWKLALHLRPWSMLDVYLLGAFVAYTRLDRLAELRIGVGGYALAGLVVVQVLIQQALGQRRVWDAIGDPAPYAPAPGQPWILCTGCELVVAAPGGVPPRRCPRCAARLEPRRRSSLAAAAALTAAGYILYLPANLLPVLTILRFGRSDTSTILGGVRELGAAGLWPLALLVLFASIVVPALKLGALSWFLVAIRLKSARLLRQRTSLYRLVEFLGRWSNIDVFMISIVVALLQFGELTRVDPGAGAVSFAAVIVLTMIATRVFDPRLMWDAAAEGRV